ncbi:diguanylate cyclase domain-containing protein [Leminorella grimontii]|uniref:diguanylate cyclase domain-containing protein n=1 Tax=Leminorella grimontii TaxID=82981 RepID=UPI00308411B6
MLSLIDIKRHEFSNEDEKHFRYFAKIIERYFHYQEEGRRLKSIENSLTNSESMFIQTFNLAAVGMANVSLSGKWLKVNGKLCDMLGYTEDEMLSRTFQDVTHPDDLHIGFELIDDLLNDRIQTYTTEKRYIDKKGRVFWILLSVSLVRDAQHNPSHFITAVVNINEKVEMENALKKLAGELESRVKDRTEQLEIMLRMMNAEVEKNNEIKELLNIERNRLKEITDNVPALISCINHDYYYTFANKTYSDWFNIPPQEIIGKRVPEVVGEHSFLLAERYLSSMMKGEKVVYENQFVTQEGLKHVQTTLIPNPDPSRGEFYVLSLDISELKSLQDSLIVKASHDALTGLPNRRAFMESLQQLLPSAKSQWIALFFMDLDRFKAINDNHGHEFGDRVLQTVAQTLKHAVRSTDIAARLAGDEFTILLHGDSHPRHVVTDICERLLKTLASIKRIGETPVNLSMSIGVIIKKNAPDVTPEWLISQADKAMYQVKANGRGTYKIIEEE